MNKLNNISNVINYFNSIDFIRVILYGDTDFDVTNFKITATMKFIKTKNILKKFYFILLIC